MKQTYSNYTVMLNPEPDYYGGDVTQPEADRIVERLGNLLRKQFPGIQVERWVDGRSSTRVVGPDDRTVDSILSWIDDNWMAAL